MSAARPLALPSQKEGTESEQAGANQGQEKSFRSLIHDMHTLPPSPDVGQFSRARPARHLHSAEVHAQHKKDKADSRAQTIFHLTTSVDHGIAHASDKRCQPQRGQDVSQPLDLRSCQSIVEVHRVPPIPPWTSRGQLEMGYLAGLSHAGQSLSTLSSSVCANPVLWGGGCAKCDLSSTA